MKINISLVRKCLCVQIHSFILLWKTANFRQNYQQIALFLRGLVFMNVCHEITSQIEISQFVN